MARRFARCALFLLPVVALVASCRHGGVRPTMDIGTYLGGEATLVAAQVGADVHRWSHATVAA